jgi:hypothetical protein
MPMSRSISRQRFTGPSRDPLLSLRALFEHLGFLAKDRKRLRAFQLSVL